MKFRLYLDKITAILLTSLLLLALCACAPSANATPSVDTMPSGSSSAQLSWDGTYYGFLKGDVLETLIISDAKDQTFHFQFVETGFSGWATITNIETPNYAYYYDKYGQTLGFILENSRITIAPDYRYLNLVAVYTPIEPVRAPNSLENGIYTGKLMRSDEDVVSTTLIISDYSAHGFNFEFIGNYSDSGYAAFYEPGQAVSTEISWLTIDFSFEGPKITIMSYGVHGAFEHE